MALSRPKATFGTDLQDQADTAPAFGAVSGDKLVRAEETSDESLMGILQRGGAKGEAAYGKLVDRNSRMAFTCALRIVNFQTALAEDVVQKAFIKLWQQADKFDPSKAKFTTWFYRVVTNQALDETRRRRDTPLPDGFDTADPRASAEDLMLERDQNRRQQQQVKQALEQVTDGQRIALTLTYFEALSNAEAAAVMEISVKALESHLVRGRRQLRQILSTNPMNPDDKRGQHG